MSHVKNNILTTCLLLSVPSHAMLIKRLAPNTRGYAAQQIKPIKRSCSYRNYLCPGLEALNKASDGQSIIFKESKKSPSLDSEYLDQMISDSIKHYDKVNEIQQLETAAYTWKHCPLGHQIITMRLKKERENYPYYQKTFRNTLSNDDKRQLESTIQELTKNIKNNDISSELLYLSRAFRGLPWQRE